jgi:hypothetical protein
VSQDAERLAPLSVHHAFVVHFRVNREVSPGCVTGRVKRVVPAQSARFASLQDLPAFTVPVLATVRAPPCKAKSTIKRTGDTRYSITHHGRRHRVYKEKAN